MPALQQAHILPHEDETRPAAPAHRDETPDLPVKDPANDLAASGRRAAGEDPVKREQIIDGAKRVFMAMGYDAASMNDITREAGVSKGTIYVYFDGKDDLFAAMIERERARVIASVKHALHAHTGPIEAVLKDFGTTFATHICADQTVRGMRMVVSVSERMPALCQRFFSASPENGYTILRAYLEAKIAEGLLEIDDTELASRQFIELCMPGLFKRRLFGWMPEPPAPEEVDRTVRSAVRMFLGAYGVKS